MSIAVVLDKRTNLRIEEKKRKVLREGFLKYRNPTLVIRVDIRTNIECSSELQEQ